MSPSRLDFTFRSPRVGVFMRWLSLLVVLSFTVSAQAEDWPMWRGPRLDGHSSEKNLPLKWSAKENIAWQASLPGVGHSSPIVQGERVFITSCDLKTKERILFAFDRVKGTE